MKPSHHSESRKRPVNLTLNADLVNQARDCTDNLSALVESLLYGYLETEHRNRLSRQEEISDAIAKWKAFDSKYGSFADEYSTL